MFYFSKMLSIMERVSSLRSCYSCCQFWPQQRLGKRVMFVKSGWDEPNLLLLFFVLLKSFVSKSNSPCQCWQTTKKVIMKRRQTQIEDLLHIFDQIFKLKPLKGPIQFYFECFVGVMTFRVTTFDRVECLCLSAVLHFIIEIVVKLRFLCILSYTALPLCWMSFWWMSRHRWDVADKCQPQMVHKISQLCQKWC